LSFDSEKKRKRERKIGHSIKEIKKLVLNQFNTLCIIFETMLKSQIDI